MYIYLYVCIHYSTVPASSEPLSYIPGLQCISCFGPSAAAARIETSKVWAKDFMRRNGIPTAEYQTFTDFEAARTYIESAQHRTVIKVRLHTISINIV